MTVAGGGAEPRGGFEYRLQVPGEHSAAQHRSKCLSLWSAKRKRCSELRRSLRTVVAFNLPPCLVPEGT